MKCPLKFINNPDLSKDSGKTADCIYDCAWMCDGQCAITKIADGENLSLLVDAVWGGWNK